MSKFRPIAAAALALALLGAAGYAYLSPPFAATCKAAYGRCAAWVSRQRAAAEQAYKKTALSAAVDREQKRRAADKQQKLLGGGKDGAQPPASKGNAGSAATAKTKSKPKAPSAAELRRQERASWSPGQRIANGPAFLKNKGDFGFSSAEQMAAHVDRVVSYASASNTKQLAGGRTAYWDERTKSVVIVDPDADSGGTAFKPKQGRRHFENLK